MIISTFYALYFNFLFFIHATKRSHATPYILNSRNQERQEFEHSDDMESSKRHSLLSLIFILNCFSKTYDNKWAWSLEKEVAISSHPPSGRKGGGLFPYISYFGMCHPIGQGFCAVLVLKLVYTLPPPPSPPPLGV